MAYWAQIYRFSFALKVLLLFFYSLLGTKLLFFVRFETVLWGISIIGDRFLFHPVHSLDFPLMWNVSRIFLRLDH
jgi:hypothetical protein